MLSGFADVHVPFPIVQGLRTRGMDVVTAQDRTLERADDDVLLSLALREQRVMLTCDHDFLRLASSLLAQGQQFAPIYFWPQQGRSIGEMIRRILRESNQGDITARVHVSFFYNRESVSDTDSQRQGL